MGKLPNWLGELKNLKALDLSNNKFEGPIPASLGTLQHLEFLSLLENELNGISQIVLDNFLNYKTWMFLPII
ncbi:unnamed protein product, partial [Vitis vinifera]|uniref:Leucine-rich repeat and WD repeat-containing protein 1 LRR domain-containing protein n=1 Tax=Vitis vinifera TaxID=29760 RepID=D7T2R5_VITVI